MFKEHTCTHIRTNRLCTHTRARVHNDAIMMDSDLGTQEYLKAALKEMERRKARQINKVLGFLFFFFVCFFFISHGFVSNLHCRSLGG